MLNMFFYTGTLLSTESIAKKLAAHFGQEKAQTIATTWRKYQLEYTWRLNSMGMYSIVFGSFLHSCFNPDLSVVATQQANTKISAK